MCHLNPLTKDALKDIMTLPKNALVKQYKKLFEMDDIDFSITSGAIDYIVEKAFEFKIGARGLRTLCEAILNDAMFNLPDSGVKELKITKVYADQKIQNVDISHLKAVS
jgi:ATP-dependent Clp protease ATP-binding subunit ClpX